MPFTWDPYLAELKDGPLTIGEITARIFGSSEDMNQETINRNLVSKVMQRTTRNGLTQRVQNGLYGLPGDERGIPTPQNVLDAIRKRRHGMTIADVMIEFDASHSLVVRRLQYLARTGLCAWRNEVDLASPKARIRRYFAVTAPVRATPALTEPCLSYRSTGMEMPEDARLDLELALIKLERRVLRRHGMEGWHVTLSLRKPTTRVRYTLTRDKLDVSTLMAVE